MGIITFQLVFLLMRRSPMTDLRICLSNARLLKSVLQRTLCSAFSRIKNGLYPNVKKGISTTIRQTSRINARFLNYIGLRQLQSRSTLLAIVIVSNGLGQSGRTIILGKLRNCKGPFTLRSYRSSGSEVS